MPGAGPEHAVRVLSKNRSCLGLKRPFRPRTRIQFYGMFRGAWSISTVCTAFGRELTRRLGVVALESYDGGRYFDTGLERFSHVDNDAPVGIFYGFPNEIPEAFQRHPFRVGGFVCKTDRIDASWVDTCNTLDLVVVPSTFCRRAFGDSGVQTPTMVVPHGLEPEYQPTRPKHRTTPLVFYNTFYESSLLPRKSVDELIGCFLEAFGRTGERAVLNLRTELSHQLVDVRKRHDFGEAVRLRPMEHLDTASFAALYSEVHCAVHPSKGEGFGLVPLQPIACETPVIATAVTRPAVRQSWIELVSIQDSRTAGRVAAVATRPGARPAPTSRSTRITSSPHCWMSMSAGKTATSRTSSSRTRAAATRSAPTSPRRARFGWVQVERLRRWRQPQRVHPEQVPVERR